MMAISLEPDIKNKMIAQLLQQGMDTSPIQSHWQGASRVAQALLGSYGAKEQEREGKEATGELFKIWQGQQQAGMPQPHPQGPVTTGPRPDSAPPAYAPPPAPPGSTNERVGSAFAALQPQPASPQPQMGQAPAAIRFNNPGAQYPGPSANAFGATGSATIGGGHKIAQFPDPVSGAAAQFHLLNRAYVGMPLAQAIQKWSGGNNSGPYVAAVSRATGITPDTPITPELLQSPQGVALVQAMAKHESGRDFPLAPEQWQQAQALAFGGGGGGGQPVRMASAGGMPQGMGAPQMPPGGAPMAPQGAPQGMPQQQPQQMAQAPNVRMIQQMINHPNPRVRAMGTQMMQHEMARQPKDQVVGDQLVRIGPNGQVQPLYDATKKTDDERNLASENRSRAERQLPPLSMTDFKAANASAAERGKQQGEATAMLPQAQERVTRALQGIQEVRDHSGRMHGASSYIAGALPGTAAYDFKKRVDQLKGGAFLEAFQMLKGGGAITEAEGAKASIAMERMDRALSKSDFDKALKDYEDAVRSGFTKLQLKARGESNVAGQPAQDGGAPNNNDPLGIRR